MRNENKQISISLNIFPIIVIATMVLLILKCCGIGIYSWTVVFIPLLVYFGLVAVIAVLALIILIIGYLVR